MFLLFIFINFLTTFFFFFWRLLFTSLQLNDKCTLSRGLKPTFFSPHISFRYGHLGGILLHNLILYRGFDNPLCKKKQKNLKAVTGVNINAFACEKLQDTDTRRRKISLSVPFLPGAALCRCTAIHLLPHTLRSIAMQPPTRRSYINSPASSSVAVSGSSSAW